MKETIVKPLNLLWLLPVILLSSRFEDQIVSMAFAITLSIVTSRIFPLIDYKEEEKE